MPYFIPLFQHAFVDQGQNSPCHLFIPSHAHMDDSVELRNLKRFHRCRLSHDSKESTMERGVFRKLSKSIPAGIYSFLWKVNKKQTQLFPKKQVQFIAKYGCMFNIKNHCTYLPSINRVKCYRTNKSRVGGPI